MNLGNPTVPNILRYEATTAGSDITNLTPVTLRVNFVLEIPQAYKPGIGRPTLEMNTSATVRDFRAVLDNNASVVGGEPKKGLRYTVRMTMPPGTVATLLMFGTDFSRTMLPNNLDISVTDDWGGAGAVNPVTKVRPQRDEKDEIVTQDNISIPDALPSNGAYFARWYGVAGTDKLAAGNALNGIPSITYNPDSGVISCYNGFKGHALLNYELAPGNVGSFTFLRAGRSNGNLNYNRDNTQKCMMWIELDSNTSSAVDFLLLPPDGLQVFCNIVFFPGSFDDRFRSPI